VVLASRVIGMVRGSIEPVCASHSAAIASARAFAGRSSAMRFGVFTPRPSSSTCQPSSVEAMETVW
jgi:hypothetical protein